MSHPFDRYAPLTDLSALKEACGRPIRKSMRVNTLKSSVSAFRKWAEEKGWKIKQVEWCSEGFFVERADERALGRDLLHQLGRTYMQEAASMLPVELLDPQPGECVLDMAAAPGSKTTQIAAKMLGRGVLIANDVQEGRLWTLKQALGRCGVTNSLVTKKRGEWFGKHMTERFDRVLCDAPCSAQGILRKDPHALKYGSDERIEKLANAQVALLEASIHAAKIGGRIVYSTCTLTPEENEEVVMRVMEKVKGVEVIDIMTSGKLKVRSGKLQHAIEDSIVVQKNIASHLSLTTYPYERLNGLKVNLSFLRLWPQTYDTEGFFCAVLEKRERTKEPITLESIPLQEKPLSKARQGEIVSILDERFGTSFIHETEMLFERADQAILVTEEVARFPLPVQNYALGFPFAKGIRDSAVFRLTHDLVTLRGTESKRNTLILNDEQLITLLTARDTTCTTEIEGEMILLWREIPIGLGLAKEGVLKNRLSRNLLKQVSF